MALTVLSTLLNCSARTGVQWAATMSLMRVLPHPWGFLQSNHNGILSSTCQGAKLAIKPWESTLAIAIGAGFFYFMWSVRRAASHDKLLGEVREVRRKWLWALEAGRLLVIRHDTHNSSKVRLQFRKPGVTLAIRLNPNEAQRVASLLRRAAGSSQAGLVTADQATQNQ